MFLRSSTPPTARNIGAAVAGRLAAAPTWSDKVMRLLDLAEAAPSAGAAQRLAFEVLEQPLSEILESRAGLVELCEQLRERQGAPVLVDAGNDTEAGWTYEDPNTSFLF